MNILLETERLRLRRFTPADADHLFALDNDPDVMHFINGGEPTPRHIIENDILPTFLRYDARGYGIFAAEEKATGNFVGWFSLRAVEETPDEAALGYRLHKAAWGKGYATEGARALIDKGFGEWGIVRIVATTYEHNLGSRRVMAKVGLTFVRSFRYAAEDLQSDTSYSSSDEMWDGEDVVYALERIEWEKSIILIKRDA
ncbi:MAG: GNAT family N-acetyltransferase [Chloroflexota bacterium]